MKNTKTALFVAMIFFLVIIAYSFIDNVSVKNTSIAQNQAVKQQGTEEQYPTAKANSFSAGNVFGEEQGNPNTTTAINNGKNYLLTQVNHRIRQLRPFTGNIEKMANLNASERKNVVSELNAEIDMFESLKSEISRSTTKEDVKNVADKVKAEWIKSRRSVGRAEELVLVSKENQLVSDAEAASLGIQKRIDSLKTEGKDAKTYEKLLAAYSKKVASAKQDVESANEKFNAVASTSTDDEKEKLIKGKDLLLESSQENIREAYKLLTQGARDDFSRKFK